MQQERIVRQLERVRNGEHRADEELIRLLYPQLQAMARRARAAVGRPDSPGTNSLVHEAYLKLMPRDGEDWESRRHFLAVAARAMRQVLVDAARSRLAEKRGGGAATASLPASGPGILGRAHQILSLDLALSKLERVSPRLRRVVELRFFAELSIEETADVLSVTPRTVNRDWQKAKLFIQRELGQDVARE